MTDTMLSALEPDEKILAEWHADKAIYWRDNGILAVAGALGVGVVLALLGNPHILIGAAGGAAAVIARAAFLASEVLGVRWLLTDRRLIGPGVLSIRLRDIEIVRRLLGDVQVITKGGHKHLLRYLPGGEGVIAAITAARDARHKALQ